MNDRIPPNSPQGIDAATTPHGIYLGAVGTFFLRYAVSCSRGWREEHKERPDALAAGQKHFYEATGQIGEWSHGR